MMNRVGVGLGLWLTGLLVAAGCAKEVVPPPTIVATLPPTPAATALPPLPGPGATALPPLAAPTPSPVPPTLPATAAPRPTVIPLPATVVPRPTAIPLPTAAPPPTLPATAVPRPTAIPIPTATPAAVPAPPQPFLLLITEPQNQSVVSNSAVRLSGRTSPDALVSVNGLPVLVNPSGVFSEVVRLNPGPNIIEVVAANNDGQVKSAVIAVIYRP